ncbi:hypothetical protein ACJ41O_014888 [Fusarium nematophilum]
MQTSQPQQDQQQHQSTVNASSSDRDPPGDIATTWRLSGITQPFWPYPFRTRPIVPETSDSNRDWLRIADTLDIFTYNLPQDPSLRLGVIEAKSQHIQFFFWTCLDRYNRRNALLWRLCDMQGMLRWWQRCLNIAPESPHGDGLWPLVLLTSPWFDCPVFLDILWEPVKGPDGEDVRNEKGKVVVARRNPWLAGRK